MSGESLGQRHHLGGFICDCCWLVLGFSQEEVEWRENQGLTAHNYPSEQGHLEALIQDFLDSSFFHSSFINPWISLDT